MSDALARLEPQLLWKYFASIAAIPRPSKHEEKLADWIRTLANEQGFKPHTDKAGNLVLQVPPTEGLERARTVILQNHMDMVCEKNFESTHDFMTDPIQPRIEGEWVRASGTTLGADNGIGIAAALAVATDPAVVHGPLELLFTVDEETGLTGAAELDSSLLTGKILLNLDSEDDGVLFVGCAGGADNLLTLTPEMVAPSPGGRAFKLEIGGLRGGHSGAQIHENRGNALKIVTRIIVAAIESGVQLELIDLIGGKMRNAIPREAVARIFLPDGAEKKFRTVIERELRGMKAELRRKDEGLRTQFIPGQHDSRVLAREDRNRFLRLLMILPHGVLGLSPEIEGLVETSNCLAVVEPHEGAIRIVASSRSSLGSTLDALLASIRAAGALAGAEVDTVDRYPGWSPNFNSSVLETMRGVYSEIWNKEPEVTVVHAGLECGLLGQKFPGLEMISFGPRIEGAHSPDERVHITSVDRFYTALKSGLRVLAE